MSEKIGPYRVVDLSPARRVTINMLDLAEPKHSIYGLLEVDVTVARQFIAEHKARTGEALSFTGFLTHCLVPYCHAASLAAVLAVQSLHDAEKPGCHN